ncbi:hypothetical protein pb186bvf_003350 [Paramecium bursaria]
MRRIKTEQLELMNIPLTDRYIFMQDYLKSMKHFPQLLGCRLLPDSNRKIQKRNNVCTLSDIASRFVSKQPRDSQRGIKYNFTISNNRSRNYKLHNKPSRFQEYKQNHKFHPLLSPQQGDSEVYFSGITTKPSQRTRQKTDSLKQKDLSLKITANTFQSENNIVNSPTIAQITRASISDKPKLEPINPVAYIDEFNKERLTYGSRNIQQLISSNRFFQPKRKSKYTKQVIRLALLEMLTYLQKLKLTIKEFTENKIFPSKPYERQQSKMFIQYVRMNKQSQVDSMLENEKYLVYEYDNLMMTPLHWSSLRGYKEITLKLLKYGADPDSQDISGRTPLYVALQNKRYEVAQILLANRANPWSINSCDYQFITNEDKKAREVISNSRKLHILLRMTPPNLRKDIWQREQLSLIKYDN